MKTYGQYCPVARACEILGQRWTLLILRDVLYGARRFNDIRRGVPRMSQSLLTHRLRDLEKFRIIDRICNEDTGITEYHPTAAARELEPLITLLGAWGQRWVRNRLGDDELDVSFLMWWMYKALDAGKFPPGRTVIGFVYTDRPRLKKENWWVDRWWLVVEDDEVDLCVRDPGHEVDLIITTNLRTMTAVYMGDLPIARAMRSKAITIQGSRQLRKGFERWMPISDLAGIPPPPEPLDMHAVLSGCVAPTLPEGK